MRIIELIIDEEALLAGIEAISIVDKPAIEEKFIALSKDHKIQLAEVDSEKRILMGAALVPNKNIYRQTEDDEYYIYFSEDTVRKASELFLMKGNQNKSTLEHQASLNGLSVVESWIIEDEVHDNDDPEKIIKRPAPTDQALRYEEFIAPMVKAIQELEARVAAIE